MGWFWASASAPSGRPTAPHPVPNSSATPPPGCPMHKTSDAKDTVASSPSSPSQSSPLPSSCPIANGDAPTRFPVTKSKKRSPNDSTTSSSLSDSSRSTIGSYLNPLNYMPNLSQERAPNQTTALPTQRTLSTIPRGDGSRDNWEYPSPQQMYNAMIRKGHDDTPEDAVESMVEIHNFLNEGAWNEIVGWEARFVNGLKPGWRFCALGEEDGGEALEKEFRWRRGEEPRLARFMGRPGEMTPKARMLEVMGWMWPSKFAGVAPFDRHDWFVQRAMPDGHRREIRYVIDYYSAPPEPTGQPVFYLDVRPAVDTPTAACERLMRWSGDVWYRASGAKARKPTDAAAAPQSE